MPERTVMVVSGSRADYGHLYWVLREIAEDPEMRLFLAMTGQHLSAEFGETWRAAKADGFEIGAKVDIGLGGDTRLEAAQATGRGVVAFAELIEATRPDIVLVLGDRFEIFAAASAAFLMNVPIAHIHGGEVTEGAFDDSMRHAITKMARYHFVAAPPYRERVVQLGEDPAAVFVTGAPGLDHFARTPLPGLGELSEKLGRDIQPGFLLVTYHPETSGEADNARDAGEMIAALETIQDRHIILTGVNADPGNEPVGRALRSFAERSPERVNLVTSLGHALYLAAVRDAGAVVGNSSSGLIEAPAVATPTVNVGDRQKGRLRTASVIDCPADRTQIIEALDKVLDDTFRQDLSAPAEADGKASVRIKEYLKSLPCDAAPKRFHDIADVAHAC